MNRLILYIFQGVMLLGLFSCEFDDIEDKYDYSTVYFIYQDYNRNIIVGEGQKLKVGVTLTGLMENREDRIVNYEVDPTLLNEITGKTLLPSDYYSLESPNQIVIPKGNTVGYMTVKIDSAKFLADSRALTGEFVLPIRIKDASGVDTIVPAKSFTRISLSYFGKQFGNYNYSGEINKFMGPVLFNASSYENNPKDGDSFRFLETINPTNFRVVADPKNLSDPMRGNSFIIHIPTKGTEVTIFPDPNSSIEVGQDGDCTYDLQTRKIHLEYNWIDSEGANCRVVEDLTFRNRIYDDQGNGIYINEWR
ncbi:MAG: DUF1735 domain-containing protein [Proteiniphilum sp.]